MHSGSGAASSEPVRSQGSVPSDFEGSSPQDPIHLSIRQLLAEAVHYLPAQGPLAVFVHHNTLHAFEHLPFEQGTEQAAALYGCEPYLSEERYRLELERGRIRVAELETVLAEELAARGDPLIAGLLTRSQLYMGMLMDPVPQATEAEIQWLIAAGEGVRSFHRRCTPWLRRQILAETRQWVMRELRTVHRAQLAPEHQPDAHLRGLSQDVLARWNEARIESWSSAVWEEVTLTLLWRLCRSGTHALLQPGLEPLPWLRLHDALSVLHDQDPDQLVNELLIRFCASFADQGLAGWTLPGREQGFLSAFASLYGQGYPVREDWLRRLPQELDRIAREGLSPEALIGESLVAFGIQVCERQAFITRSLLALRGWAGMLWQLESRPDRVQHAVPPDTLLEFLAIRLLLDRLAAEHVTESLGLGDSLAVLRHKLRPARISAHATATRRAYVLFLLAQSLGWSPQRLVGLSRSQWQSLVNEIDDFSVLRRRRLFHSAFERSYRHQVFDALAAHVVSDSPSSRPALQVLCCLDDREESFRRHLEELAPDAETFGLAGFFNLPMLYGSAEDSHEKALCPVSIRPRHRVVERVLSVDRALYARGAAFRRRLGLAAYGLQTGSHGFVRGLATTLIGSFAALPLVARVLFPRLTSRLRHQADRLVQAPVRTELVLERAPEVGPDARGIYDGFLPEEMVGIVGEALRNIGLTRDFARLVLVLGHGSSCLNNPHAAAYDCGACGGGRGGPNARAFAQMANHPAVREKLISAGLAIPPEVVFVGGYHDTTKDSVVFYDIEAIPTSHLEDLRQARELLDRTCERNAHERARRFDSASLLISPEAARRHVEGRAEDLAQPRPEAGHASNAICVVGRRVRTRGLFMDRRCFLNSYDPAADAGDENSPILTRTLQAVVPVCAGINLEYYFSYVDPTGWGCGSKLPHNITSLLGVMDGAGSDLRPGLPWQMVELHEPLRLTLVVETLPERMAGILARNPAIEHLVRNGWIVLATLDPDSARLHVYKAGTFSEYQPGNPELSVACSSGQWYGGLREHLGFASIRPESGPGPVRAVRP